MNVEQFFGRELEIVGRDFARYYLIHPDRSNVYQGPPTPTILGLRSKLSTQFYEVEQAMLYTDEFTQSRWRNSRALEIARGISGTVFAYGFRGTVNLFIKTLESANIQPHLLRRVDAIGEPIPGDENLLTPSKIAPILGLRHGDRAQLTSVDFRGRQAFILSAETLGLTAEELRQIEEEILRLGEL